MKVEKADFALITILPEEYEAIYNLFAPVSYRHPISQHTYGLSHIQTKADKIYTVAIARTSRAGNDASQQLVSRMIYDLDPQILLIVGIGGGVPDYDFTLGDVIISSHIHNFDLSAIKGHQAAYDISGGIHPAVSNIVAGLGFYRKQLADWNSEASIGMARPTLLLTKEDIQSLLDKGIDQAWRKKVEEVVLWHFGAEQRGKRSPKFLTGTIASSNSLVRSDALLAQWLQSARSIRAVEMEAAGVYQAAQQMRQQYPMMAMRGISDIVGFKRNDDWRRYACHTAAAFAHAFIAAGIVEPRENTPSSNKPPDQLLVPQQLENENMLPLKQGTDPVKIFTIFANADIPHKERLETQLSPYTWNGLIELSDRDRISTDPNILQQEINSHIDSSQIILLLVSLQFLASRQCLVEMEYAMRRRASGYATVIPIYIHPINRQDVPFGDLLPLPRNGRPIISWPSADEAWYDVAADVRRACEAGHKLRRNL